MLKELEEGLWESSNCKIAFSNSVTEIKGNAGRVSVFIPGT
jgi:hypothetical protein